MIVLPDSLGSGAGIDLEVSFLEFGDGDVEAGAEEDCDADLERVINR